MAKEFIGAVDLPSPEGRLNVYMELDGGCSIAQYTTLFEVIRDLINEPELILRVQEKIAK